MSAAACPNSKCTEMIHFKENTKLPFNCSKCDHLITEKHYQMFRDVTNATGMHLDKMKMSNIACNQIQLTLYWIPPFQSVNTDSWSIQIWTFAAYWFISRPVCCIKWMFIVWKHLIWHLRAPSILANGTRHYAMETISFQGFGEFFRKIQSIWGMVSNSNE